MKHIYFFVLLLPSIVISQDVHQIEKHFEGHSKENLGKAINSKAFEISPAICPDGTTLYFSRFDKGTTAFYYSSHSTGAWTKAKPMGTPFSEIQNAVGYNISPDGHTILLRGVFKDYQQEARGYSICEKHGENWTKPISLNILNYAQYDKGTHFSAWLGADETTIVMEMEPTAGSDNGNIYVSFRETDTNWTEPLNLGPTINSDETLSGTPFLAADGKTLYYTTNKYDTYGQNDLFVTHREDESWTKWTTPQNLGKVVNSETNDLYFSLPASGEYAYLVSPGEFGNHDIFKLKLPQEAKPEPVELIKGYVKDASTGKPIGTKVTVHNLETDQEIAMAHSDDITGFYEIILPKGIKYSFFAEADGYYATREHLDLTHLDHYEELQKDLKLDPYLFGEQILLNNVFFVPTKTVLLPEALPELNDLYDILQQNTKMRIRIEGHTDNQGDKAANLQLSQSRAERVVEYLVDKGITSNRLEAKGYGEAHPLNDNSTEELRKKNRRVQFTIIK